MSKWFEKSDVHGDIAISTRVRLARNLKDYPFPGRLSSEQAQEIVDAVSDYLTKDIGAGKFEAVDLAGSQKLDVMAMMERHLISPEFAEGGAVRGLVLSPDHSISIMINEEDHLRIQALGSGLCLKDAFEKAERVDDLLASRFEFAWNEQLGFLTRCPTNLGTGLRASVMLHLPALTHSGEIRSLINAISKIGFTVRGIYGEGSAASGCIYQISNQLTLGLSEEDILDKLDSVIKNTIERETQLRRAMHERDLVAFEDRAYRAFGMLTHARLLSCADAMSLLSDLRLGVSTGDIEGVSWDTLNELLCEIQPNCIMQRAGRLMTDRERDEQRAAYIRKTLS